MKRNSTLLRVVAVFCCAVLLMGTLSGCSIVSRLVNKVVPRNPLQAIPGILNRNPDRQPVSALPDESIPDDWAETEPPETEPVETEPIETEPPETEPVETEPIETEPPETQPQPTQWTGEITASVLNVREYPGMDYEVIRGLERGSRVVILEQVTVDGEAWGRVYDGWVSMKYVSLDGVIEGSWYELVHVDTSTSSYTYTYYIWNFYSDNTFGYTECSLKASENFSISRQLAQGGGKYQYNGETLHLELSHGDPVDICGSTLFLNQFTDMDADIYGATMSWGVYCHELSKGSLENIQKQLRNSNSD